MALELSKVQEALGDDYTLLEEIGRGGMAIVFLAQDHRHDRKVAVKVLKEEFAGSAHSERFLREIKLEGQLQHSHILPVFDSGASQGLLYFIMPYVEGKTLRDRLDRERMLPLEEALRIGRDIADALDHAHGKDVIHRDIKPANILLRDGHALVADFGVAKAVEESAGSTLTQTGIVVGTPAYMSPEQAGGEINLDGRSDLYSLGCVLHEMLGGEPPFTGPTTQSVLAKHLNEPVPSLSVVRPDLPPWLVNTVRKLLSKVPADRYQSAGQLAKALRSQTDLGPPTSPGFGAPAKRGMPGRRKAGLAGGSLILLMGAGLVGIPAIRDWVNPPPLQEGLIMCFPLIERGEVPVETSDIAFGIGVALENTDFLRCLDGYEYASEAERRDPVQISVRRARSIARSQGAAHFLTGGVMADGDSLFVTLHVHDVAREEELGQGTYRGRQAEASSSQIAARALNPLLPLILDPGREVDLTYFAERPASAVTSWLRGERYYRNTQFDSAFLAFSQAVAQDSLLAPAALKGSQAASWTHHRAAADTLAILAARHDTLLSARQAHFARGLVAFYRGEADSAATHYRRALELDPGWNEAWIGLGEVFHHLLPSGIIVPDSAKHAFQLAVGLDPDFRTPIIHLAEIAIFEGELERGREYLHRLQEVGAERSTLRALEASMACAEDPFPDSRWASMAETEGEATYYAGVTLARGAVHAACAEGAFKAILATGETGPEGSRTWGATLGLSGMLLAQGRIPEAAEFLRGARAAGSGSAPFLFLLGATVEPGLDPLALSIDSLGRRSFGEHFERPRTQEGWSLGIWHAAKGNGEELAALSAGLDSIAAQNPQGTISPPLARSLRGFLALHRGDTLSAIREFEGLAPFWPEDRLIGGIQEVLAFERLTLAELYLKTGTYHRALRTASIFDHGTPLAFTYFVPRSLIVRAQAAEALSYSELAEQYRDRLAKLGRSEIPAYAARQPGGVP